MWLQRGVNPTLCRVYAPYFFAAKGEFYDSKQNGFKAYTAVDVADGSAHDNFNGAAIGVQHRRHGVRHQHGRGRNCRQPRPDVRLSHSASDNRRGRGHGHRHKHTAFKIARRRRRADGKPRGGQQYIFSRVHICSFSRIRSVRVALVHIHSGVGRRKSNRNGHAVPFDMHVRVVRRDRLHHIRALFAGYGQEFIFDDRPDFGRAHKHSARLRLYLSLRLGSCGCGVGDRYRSGGLAGSSHGIPLCRQ